MTAQETLSPTESDASAHTRFRLRIAYDGTAFKGWSKQPGMPTVEGEIEVALGTLFRRFPLPARLVVAGRTDAGVHAAGQVTHIDLTAAQVASMRRRGGHGSPAASTGETLARRINGILGPTDIVVLSADVAPPGFDARFSALWRRYEYRIADRGTLRDPLQRARTLWHPDALDADTMDAAARSLLGLHDFAAYCKPRDGATTIRTLQEFGWHRAEDGVLIGSVKADAFCRNMVRALVGACVAVGRGKMHARRLAELRDDGTRGDDFTTVPAKGLTLIAVGYPPDDELAARADLTRARRTLDGLTPSGPNG